MDLEKLDIDETHKQILLKFHSCRGRVMGIQEVKGIWDSKEKKWNELSADDFVKIPHRMHHLIRGVFARKGTGYAQSLQLKPDSKWGLEIDRDTEDLLINYNFGKTGTHKGDMEQLQKCLDNKIPIGLVMNPPSEELLILGLGKVVSRNENNFVIESFGLDDDESKDIKKMALLEYDRFHREPEIDSIPKISWHKFISKFDPTESRFKKERKASESLEKSPIGVNEIIENANSTDWVIPDFQRYFVWTEEDVRGFLNSIFQGYYVGTILLWEVKGNDELGVIPVTGVENKKSLKKDKIVLDGQQRITSLNYAINSPDFALEGEGSPSFFYIDFGNFIQNPDYDEFVKVSKHVLSDEICFEKLMFPLFKLKDREEWINDLEDFIYKKIESGEKSTNEDIRKISGISRIIRDRLNFIYSDFQFPQVILPKSIPFDAVAEIFERINSTGKELDTFDLFIVRLSRYGLKLRDLWKESLAKHSKIDEYYNSTKSPVKKLNRYILETLSLSFTDLKSCKRKDILNIYKTNKETISSFEDKWRESSKYIDKAIRFIEDKQKGFGAVSREELPYEPMIPILASLLREIDMKFKDSQRNCLQKLKNWYWASVFDTRYSSGVEGKKSSDFRVVLEWFSDEGKIPQEIQNFRESYVSNLRLKDVRSRGMSKYKGVLCMLALNGATDFEKSVNFEDFKPHKDHIFPRSNPKFKMGGIENSILNMTWLTSDTNIRTKKAKPPSIYILETIEKKFKGNEEEFKKEVLTSHFISDDAFECMKTDDFEGFLNEREKVFIEEIGRLIGAKPHKNLPTMITPNTPYTNIRILRDKIQSCREYLYWVDRYFSVSDLDIIQDSIESSNITELKILLSTKFADEKMRKYFKRFRDEMSQKNINCEMRVMAKSVYDEIHDRLLISKNKSYNSVSGDTVKRGQYAEIQETLNKFPHEKWWVESKDIIDDWNSIQNI